MNKGVSIVYRNAFKDERNVRKKLFGSGIVYRVQNAFAVTLYEKRTQMLYYELSG